MANQSVPGDFQDGYRHARLALMFGPWHAEYRYESLEGRRTDLYRSGFMAALLDRAANRPMDVNAAWYRRKREGID